MATLLASLHDRLGAKVSTNRHLGRDYPERPALFLEFHSSTEASIAAESRAAEELAREAGATAVDVARTSEERAAQWEARHQLYWAERHLYPGRTYAIADAAVPLSSVPELVAYMQDLLAELRLEGSLLGHIGDGNVHAVIACTAPERARADTFSARLVERALALGGTATGEHGVGLAKRRVHGRRAWRRPGMKLR